MKHIAIILLVLTSTMVHAQMHYRWVDKEGKVHYSDEPPPQEIKKFEKQKSRIGNTVQTSTPSYTALQAMRDFPVTLYTTPNCDELCAKARSLLSSRKIPYKEVSLDTIEKIDQFKKTFSTSNPQVPAAIVGSHQLKGYSETTWTEMFNYAGYPQTTQPPTTQPEDNTDNTPPVPSKKTPSNNRSNY